MNHVILTTLNFDATVQITLIDSAVDVHIANVNKLRDGISHFRFTKKDGTIREAFGTLNVEKITSITKADPAQFKPRAENAISQSYFDLEVNDWRAYTIENIITVF